MIRTAILGASGYVGGELLRLLVAHPELTPAKLFGDSKAGQPLGAVHPHLALGYPDAVVERFGDDSLDGVDLVFAALPHGHSQRLAATILDRGIPFVDLGADFRLDDAATYERWYGHAHEAPELLDRFVYGIPELNRDAIGKATAVSAAGCYATAAILALKPLVDAGLVKLESLIVNAASGVSGAGREAKEATGFCTVTESFSAYGLINHRHTAEMEMALKGTVLFTPHLVFAPIFFALFHLSDWTRIAVIVKYTVFVIIINTAAAVRSADPALFEMAHSFGANRRQIFTRVLLPASMVLLFAGIRLGMGRAVKGMINGEMFIAFVGLGGVVQKYGSQFDASKVLAVTVVILAVSLVMGALVQTAERRMTRWAD